MAERNSGGGKVDELEAPACAPLSKRPARDRIFETARELFYQHGIRAVGVEAIAHEAEATKMTLYRNFPSKDELVAEVLREQERDYWIWWDEIVGCTCGDPRVQLEAIFDAFETKACNADVHGCPLSNAAIELHEADHPAQKVSVAYKQQLHARLVDLCQQGRRGRRRPGRRPDAADGRLLHRPRHPGPQRPGAGRGARGPGADQGGRWPSPG
jgi:AcrR family transcriptional regulator